MKQFTNNICLIGGGDLIIYCAERLIKNNFSVNIILSQRHFLEFKQNTKFKNLIKNKIKFYVTENLNKIKNLKALIKKNSTAICFGPSWIFTDKIINYFEGRIYNVNQVPLPKYMGGAHFTWQILNQNKEGGIFLQKIIKKLDQGPILLSKKYKLSKNDILPEHYFNKSFYYGKFFINQILTKLKDKKNFKQTKFDKLYLDREYFPRLMTKKQAYINWNWDAKDILLFCNSFDSPYSGALTFHENKKISFKNVKLSNLKKYHPFASGLVIKKIKNKIFIATKIGTLEISKCLENDNLINQKIKQGDRFYTPSIVLDNANIFKAKYK